MVVYGMFQLEGKPWLNLFRSCHKIARFETLYSVHLVHGESINAKVVTTGRPGFNPGSAPLYSGVDPVFLYSQVSSRVSQHQQGKIFALRGPQVYGASMKGVVHVSGNIVSSSHNRHSI